MAGRKGEWINQSAERKAEVSTNGDVDEKDTTSERRKTDKSYKYCYHFVKETTTRIRPLSCFGEEFLSMCADLPRKKANTF